MHALTSDGTPPTFLAEPRIVQSNVDSLDLTFSINEEGRMFYTVSHTNLSALFFARYMLSFSMSAVSPEEIVSIAEPDNAGILGGAWPDGIVAAGVVAAPANVDVPLKIKAQCRVDICALLENTNQTYFSPATVYRVSLLAVDTAGNAQGVR
ncbi:MAG: hypothetical protein HC868_10285, partial [Sphingomonadales bacterium]|nr:hypothetical protein [Sphingomonadales bacterium]